MTAYQGGKKRLGKELYQVIEDFSFNVFEETINGKTKIDYISKTCVQVVDLTT
jgi:hypothetical protein